MIFLWELRTVMCTTCTCTTCTTCMYILDCDAFDTDLELGMSKKELKKKLYIK